MNLTPLYKLPMIVSSDPLRSVLQDYSATMAQRVEALLTERGVDPLDGDVADVLRRIGQLEASSKSAESLPVFSARRTTDLGSPASGVYTDLPWQESRIDGTGIIMAANSPVVQFQRRMVIQVMYQVVIKSDAELVLQLSDKAGTVIKQGGIKPGGGWSTATQLVVHRVIPGDTLRTKYRQVGTAASMDSSQTALDIVGLREW